MKLDEALAQLDGIISANPAHPSRDKSGHTSGSRLTWAFLSDGMADHIRESKWIGDANHVFTWVVRLSPGDTVHGRLPEGYDEWVALVQVDETVDRAVILGRERYCCATSADRGADHECRTALEDGFPVQARLEDVLPYLRAIGF